MNSNSMMRIQGIPYEITWIAFGHLLGVFSPPSSAILAGITIHMITALSIGIVIGVFLYKTNILIISKLSNGILYGLFAGSVVYIVFFIPSAARSLGSTSSSTSCCCAARSVNGTVIRRPPARRSRDPRVSPHPPARCCDNAATPQRAGWCRDGGGGQLG